MVSEHTRDVPPAGCLWQCPAHPTWGRLDVAGPTFMSKEGCLSLLGLSEHNGVRCVVSQKLFPHSFGGWGVKIKVRADCIPGESYLLGLKTAAFLLCSHGLSSECAWKGRESEALWCLFLEKTLSL